MSSTSDERLYKRKLNEFDQELRRLQKELAKLKILKREGGRARKQLMRALQREAEVVAIHEDEEAQRFNEIQTTVSKYRCSKCSSYDTITVEAGSRNVVVCQECGSRRTAANKIAETA